MKILYPPSREIHFAPFHVPDVVFPNGAHIKEHSFLALNHLTISLRFMAKLGGETHGRNKK